MKQLEIFYLSGCPYCHSARKAVEELLAENADYGSLSLRWIEETQESALADSRDYYSVPTIFYQGEKLYEAHFTHSYDTIKQSVRAAFDKVLAG